MGKFEVYKSKGQWYFRLKAGNGEIIAQSEGYKTKQGAMKGVASVQLNAGRVSVQIVDKKEKVIVNNKKLVKGIVAMEKNYDNKKKPDITKSEDEKDDEKKVLTSGPIKSWKRVGPSWM